MGDSNHRKGDTAETSDDSTFDRMMNSMTALKEDQKALDAILSTKRKMDAKVQEKVARVKVQALQVIEAATRVLDRLSALDGSESLVPSQLTTQNETEEVDCQDPPCRFTNGARRVVTQMLEDRSSKQRRDIIRSIRHVCIFQKSPYGLIFRSHAFMSWGYTAQIQAEQRSGNLSVRLILQPGPNDSSLSWPFKKTFTFTLVHPTDGSLDVRYRCVPPDTTDQTGPFGRPGDKPSTGCGTDNLCTIQFMKENGFFVGDDFCISIEIFK